MQRRTMASSEMHPANQGVRHRSEVDREGALSTLVGYWEARARHRWAMHEPTADRRLVFADLALTTKSMTLVKPHLCGCMFIGLLQASA